MDQLVEIIKVLGTPTREELMAMNPNYTELPGLESCLRFCFKAWIKPMNMAR